MKFVFVSEVKLGLFCSIFGERNYYITLFEFCQFVRFARLLRLLKLAVF